MISFEFSLYRCAVYETCGRVSVHAFWARFRIPPYWIPKWKRLSRNKKKHYCATTVPLSKHMWNCTWLWRRILSGWIKDLSLIGLSGKLTGWGLRWLPQRGRRRLLQNDDEALVQGAGARRCKAHAYIHSGRCAGPQGFGDHQQNRSGNAHRNGKGGGNGKDLLRDPANSLFYGKEKKWM